MVRNWILEKRLRIILSGTLIVAVPIICLALFVYIGVTGHLRKNIEEENKLAALNIAIHIEDELRGDIRNGSLFSTRLLLKEAIKQRDTKKITRHLKNFVDHIYSVGGALVADRTGILLANYSEDSAIIGKSVSDRDWYKGVSRNWEPYVSEYYLSACKPQKYLFAISLPIRDGKSVIGILVLKPTDNYIRDSIARITAPGNQKVYIVDKKGNLVHHADYRVDKIIDYTAFPSVKKVMSGQSGVEILENPDGALMVTAYQPIERWGWGVIVQRPESVVYGPLRKLIFGLFAFTAAMSGIGAYLAYRRSETLFSLKRLSGELEIRVSERTADLTGAVALLRSEIETRKQAEDDLKASEKRYRVLVENAQDAIFTLSTEGTFLSLNPAFETITGLPRAEWLDKHFGSIIHPGDLPLALDHFQKALRDEQQPVFELSLLLNSEREVTCELSVTPQIRDGVVVNITGIARDITNRKKAEKALQESEEKYRTLVDNSLIGIFKTNLSGDFIYANNALTALLEFKTPQEMMTEGIMRRYKKAADRDMLTGMLKSTGKVDHVDLEFLTRTGKTKTVILSAVIEGDLISGMVIDNTERKRAEDALQKSEEFAKNILESVGEGLIVLDTEYRIVSANKAYCEQAKSQYFDVVGRHCYAVSHHFDRPCFLEGEECAPAYTLKTGMPHECIHKHTDSEGNHVYVEAKSYPIKNTSGKVTAVIETMNDITERRKLEAQLRHAQKMEAVGTLAGGIAHDFNNILNVVMGYGGLVLDKMEPDSPSREHMYEVLAAAERAATLTKRLLAFSRKQVVEMIPVDVNGIISGVQKMLSRVIGEDIDLKVHLADKRLTVLADAGQIEQVLMTLATNARDAMPKGGRLTIATETAQMDDAYIAAYGYGKPGAYSVLAMTDTGKGMDAETKTKIFEPFFTTKGIGEGTGLGLAISYGIVKQHNGYIQCYSEPGKGTAFKIYLPLIGDKAASGIMAEASGAIKGGTETILVAEDDPSLRKLTRIVLESFGYNVIPAEDGEEAVEKFMENRGNIQLVILDLIMPKKSGKEAYEDIKKMSPEVRTFFLSGYTTDMISRMDIVKGMELIRKPFAPNDLLKKVREVLDR